MAIASPRRLTLAVLFLLGLAVLPLPAASEQEDARLIAEMSKKREEIKQQLRVTQGAAEQMKLIEALNATTEETVSQLTPAGRTLVKCRVEVIEPWEQAELDYKKMTTDLANAAVGDLTTVKTRSELQSRISALARNDQATRQLFAQTNGLEPAFSQIVNGTGISPAEKQALMRQFHADYDSRTVLNRDVRNLNVLMTAQAVLLMSYLEQHWGKWQLSDRRPVFADATLETQFQDHVAELGAMLQRVAKAKQALKPNP